MRITKFGHSCLFVEEAEARILIDPGRYSFIEGKMRPEDLPNFDALLFTHEHGDHLDLEALPRIIKGRAVPVWTNNSVSALLRAQGFESKILMPAEEITFKGLSIKAIGGPHGPVPLAPGAKLPENIGFLIADRFLHPGDSLEPEIEEAEILALPVMTTWGLVKDALLMTAKLSPKIVIPVHDAYLKEWFRSPYEHLGRVAKENNFKVAELTFGEPIEV